MEQKDTFRVAVLMTVHNRCETTVMCLRHLAQMQYDRSIICIDIYMTDDGCTDGTAEAVREQFPEVQIINGDGNLFWNRGMHLAWSKASEVGYDFYWWVNDDTLVYEDCLTRLMVCSVKYDNQAIIIGSTCSSKDQTQVTYGGWLGHNLIQPSQNDIICKTFNGNIVFIPSHVYNAIGINDPYYRHSLGDTDYALRASKEGIKSVVAPGFFGICDLHPKPTVWKDPDQPFIKRWSNFFSPTGNNPFEFFYLRKKFFGIIPALCTLVSNFIHLFFPYFWKQNLRNA